MDISALKKSEEQYRNLFENTMHEVHLWKLVRDDQGEIKTWRLVEANPAALKAWGKTRSEIIGKTTDEVFLHNATEQFMSVVKKIFSEGTPYTWEAYFPPTGQFLYMTSVPFGEYFMSTGTDITHRKQTEDALRESEERHRLFHNPSFGGSIIHDQGFILDCSKGVTNITGYSHNELVGMDGLLLIAPDWRDWVMDKIISGCEEPYEVEGIRKDGTIFPLRLHAQAIQYHGKPARVVEFRDISDIKKAEQALKKSENLLRNVIDSSTDYIFVKDKNLKTILCNQKFAQAVNKKPSDLIGKTDIENGWDAELVKGNPDKGITGYEKYDLEALNGKIVENTDTAVISGETLFFNSVKIPLKDENNQIFGVLGISRDITEQKKAEKKLREMVEFDALTRVYSRQYLLGLAERLLMRIKQDQTSLLCMMFDIDHFKSINDKYGHKTGDIALIEFSKIVSKNLRSNDIFGRVGGEEFLAVVPEISLEVGKKLAERIRLEVEQMPITVGGDCITMTVSIGISIYEKNMNLTTFDELVELSDRALYVAKNNGRNRVCVMGV